MTQDDEQSQLKPPQYGRSFCWQFNRKIAVFSAIFVVLFCALGVWQLERAKQKQTLQENWAHQQSLPPLSTLQAGPKTQYRRFSSKGRYDAEQFWLVENKTLRGRNGYHVLMPFALDSGEILIVNRGWVPGTGHRDRLPELDLAPGLRLVSGNLAKPSDHRMLSMQAQADDAPWPRVILEPTLNEMAKELNVPLGDKILHIDASSDSAFAVNWQAFTMSAAKHTGYAVQWFLMAVVLAVASLCANSNVLDIMRNK